MNPDQLEVVAHRGVPLLVLAAAGTGKTHALTSRIADLIKRDGVPPQEILAVTFTNKAAAEMRKRASALCGVPETELCISTFHSLCARILRQYHHLLGGMRRNFMIYDTNDSLALIRRCMEEMRLTQSRSRNEEYTPQGFLAQIDTWRNDGLEPDAVPREEYMNVASKSFAHRIYTAYRARCVSCHAVDFSDLILHTLRVLRADEDARNEVRGRWRHILVDEFQDTNRAQMQLLDLLLADTTEFMAVGDDCQAIHEWRGAHIQNILRFTDRFPDARTVTLQTNYRSLPLVLELANEVIVKNTMRHEKRLVPSRAVTNNDVVELHELPTMEAEAAYVARRVREMVDAGRRPSDIAILYRTNAMSVPLETSLAAKGVPFHVRGACPFFGRTEVKDVVAYLRLALNPRSDVDLRRVINTPPRGMGAATLDKLDAAARAAGMSMYELAVADGTRHKKPARFAALLDRLAAEIREPGNRSPVKIVCDVTGILIGMAADRAENVAALAQSLAAFGGSLQEFVDRVASEEQAAEDDDAVQLMTLHASKGLEFEAVFMVGAADGILPFYRSLDGPALEEERRLCYVGITRAKDRLVITCPMKRTLRFGVVDCVRSRFFTDLSSLRGCCIAHGAPP